MSEHHNAHAEVHASVPLYVGVFVALLVLTFVTVEAARHDFGAWNNVVALTIAFTKAILVIAFFMHVRWAGKLVVLVVGSGFVFLGILFLFTMADYVSRSWPLVAG
jgi:cytochrome c oxidase subunit IV